MADLLQVVIIKPKQLKVDKIRLELLNALRAEGRLNSRELAKTTENWGGEKPTFTSIISLASGDAAVLTGPTGSTKGVLKWTWLNNGTSIRHAAMSSDWRSKTRPGRIRSTAGAGKVARVSRNIRLPGIAPRDWTGLLLKRRRGPFRARLATAMRKGARKAF